MKLLNTMIVAVALATVTIPAIAFANATSNTCKPDVDNPNVSNIVMCTWPQDPSVSPVPDMTSCQNMIRTPTSPTDDCGNSDFNDCMQNLGFQCSTTTTQG